MKFHQVLEGMEVVNNIATVPTDQDDKPFKSVIISNSGILPVSSPFEESDDNYVT